MSRAGPAGRPTSPFLVLLLGAAATALTAEWLRFQEGWALAAAPAALGAAATLAGVARSYRARRAWRRARETATAGEPLPPSPGAERPPARVQARPAREEPHPSVLRHAVPASLLGPNDLDAGDAAPERIAGPRLGRRERGRDRVETD